MEIIAVGSDIKSVLGSVQRGIAVLTAGAARVWAKRIGGLRIGALVTAGARAFIFGAVVPLCFGQIDGADVHVTPQVIPGSSVRGIFPAGEESEHLKANVNLVLVPVTVTDRQDQPMIGLGEENFSVYDRHDRQVIRHFSTEDAPVSLGILFDTSSSMRGKIDCSLDAVVRFLRSANPEDEFFVIGFADGPELLANFTSSVEEIQSAISNARADGRTALLDAIYLGLHRMEGAHNARKVLLIVSDGGENHSRYNRGYSKAAIRTHSRIGPTICKTRGGCTGTDRGLEKEHCRQEIHRNGKVRRVG